MAVIASTTTRLTDSGPGSEVIKVVWGPMANGDTGAPVGLAGYTDRSVQVTGTFGASGNCRFQGTNDGTNYAALTDPQGNDLNFTATKIEGISEIAAAVRPNITAGDGTTSITVTMIARSAR